MWRVVAPRKALVVTGVAAGPGRASLSHMPPPPWPLPGEGGGGGGGRFEGRRGRQPREGDGELGADCCVSAMGKGTETLSGHVRESERGMMTECLNMDKW